MSSKLQPVFARLCDLLRRHATGFGISHGTANHFGLDAPVGPASLQAWGNKVKSPTIRVAWVQVGKAYVSYHLMGVYGNPRLLDGYSKELRARMQGKSCFNFKVVDEALFEELDRLTSESLAGMRSSGYVGPQ
jgi:hypothetical protein